jgi:hypothetical protein
MAEQDPDAPRNLGNTKDALRTIQEKSDDIEKAEILLSQRVLTYCGYPASPLVGGTMILHLLNERFVLPPATTEAILNDGILNRMGIKIVLTP